MMQVYKYLLYIIVDRIPNWVKILKKQLTNDFNPDILLFAVRFDRNKQNSNEEKFFQKKVVDFYEFEC